MREQRYAMLVLRQCKLTKPSMSAVACPQLRRTRIVRVILVFLVLICYLIFYICLSLGFHGEEMRLGCIAIVFASCVGCSHGNPAHCRNTESFFVDLSEKVNYFLNLLRVTFLIAFC